MVNSIGVIVKKLLVLGGSQKSIPLIRYATSKGHDVVLCDRDTENPCKDLAAVFIHVSATDLDGVLEVARKYAVDGIVSFGSDVMAATAAFVGQALGLPSNPYEAVLTLGRKDLFRDFLSSHGFNSPRATSFLSVEDVWLQCNQFQLPVMVKPVDSAGSTGVSKVIEWAELPSAFDLAMGASESKRVIVEEYIQMSHPYMIAGDAFVLDGQVIFWGLMNSHRASREYPFLPTGTSYPVTLNLQQQITVQRTVQSLVDKLGIRLGGLNLELMYDESGNLYIIELAARNGGNYIPEILQYATGVDLIASLVDASLGETVDVESFKDARCVATYMIHSPKKGTFQGVIFADEIKGYVYKTILNAKIGDSIHTFDRATHAVGVLFLRFNSVHEQEAKLNRITDFVRVIVEEPVIESAKFPKTV
jgi:biotin carboxylase